MSALFSKPQIPKTVQPPAPPRPVVDETDMKAKKKKGDLANLMTGGLGLGGVASENLMAYTLGGYNSKTGVQK